MNGSGGKPKSMHWRTFRRLETQHDQLVETSLADMARRLGPLRDQFGGFWEDVLGPT